VDEFALVGSDGVEVFCRRWPAPGEARAGVVVVHGAAEHSGRYARVAEVMQSHGFTVYALDLRGHGRTGSITGPGLIGEQGVAGVLADVDLLVERAHSELGSGPIFMFGHSMGSVVVQAYVVGTSKPLGGYVLSGTMGPTEGTEEFVTGLRAALDAGMADEPLDALGAYGDANADDTGKYDWLSRDADEVAKYIADPLCGDDNPLTYGYVAAVLETIADVMEPGAIAHIQPGLPVLLLTGAADPVSENAAHVRELEARLRKAGLDVDARYYAGARHEVLNETNRDDVHRDLTDWLDRVTKR
jgi:alpha-beta hydrolase superfamily lysophospholipase